MVIYSNCNTMAKVKPSIIEYSGAVGREIHYTRFGRTYSRQLPAEYNDRKSAAQLRQRALFKARQATSALPGSVRQRGLTKEAHENGMTEANYFSYLNKDHFLYEDGTVHLKLSLPAPRPWPPARGGVHRLPCRLPACQTRLPTSLDAPKVHPDDVVHIYAIFSQVEICQLVASIEQQAEHASSELPDLSEETTNPLTFYFYAIVESAPTAFIPTLSTVEKQINRQHRNTNRRVSNSIFINALPASQH